MPRLSNEKIEQIRHSVDIVDVISSYVEVERHGKRILAKCPFHNDNRPSMNISQEKQIYKCFACNVGGDVFNFVSRYLKVPYLEAVKITAEKGNVDIPELTSYVAPIQKIDDASSVLYTMHEEAEKIFKAYLNSTLARGARRYLQDRHLDDDIIATYGIGYAPLDDALYKAFQNMNFTPVDMARSGLVIEGSQNYYDRFKDRIAFPLHDQEGRVVGFSCRLYEKKDDQAKYMNSPESDIFIKGKTLYNYHRAKEAIHRAGFVYLLEGFMDVIAMHRAGIDNTLAIMGTALTEDHLNMIRKLTDSVYICLDGDGPGQNATYKAALKLIQAHFKVRTITLNNNYDPDELLEAEGPQGLQDALKAHVSVMEFMINYEYQQSNMENYDEKRNYVDRLIPMLSKVEDDFDIDYYVSLIAIKSGFSQENIKARLNQKKSRVVHPTSSPIITTSLQTKLQDKYHRAALQLLAYMLSNRDIAMRYKKELGYMYQEEYRLIANTILYYYDSHPQKNEVEMSDLLYQLPDEAYQALATDISFLHLPPMDNSENQAITDYLKTIRLQGNELEREALIKRMNATSDSLEKARLLIEITKLMNAN